jgi:predicted RNA-binding Zn-ribbon protein involved in translation (DUF1610 family)
MTMEEKQRVIETVEDSMLGLDFTIEDGYLINIGIRVKSIEDLNRIYTSDRVSLSKWLTNVKVMLLQAVSNPPTETIELGVPAPENESEEETKCPKCGIPLVKKKACCGSTGEVLRCKDCGRSYRFSKGRIKGSAPSPSPFTQHTDE